MVRPKSSTTKHNSLKTWLPWFLSCRGFWNMQCTTPQSITVHSLRAQSPKSNCKKHNGIYCKNVWHEVEYGLDMFKAKNKGSKYWNGTVHGKKILSCSLQRCAFNFWWLLLTEQIFVTVHITGTHLANRTGKNAMWHHNLQMQTQHKNGWNTLA